MSKLNALAAALTVRVRRDDTGATAVEYGLLVALIAAVLVGIIFTVGDQLLQGFTKVSTELGKVLK